MQSVLCNDPCCCSFLMAVLIANTSCSPAMNMTHYSDIEIVTGLKNGNTRVFSFLFDSLYARLRYFAAKIITDPSQAQDIVVNAFTKLWNARSRFDSLPAVRAFLYITTRNECLDYLRYLQRQSHGRKDYTAYLLQQEDKEAAERLIIQSDLVHRIYFEMNRLPPRCREIFRLTYIEGLKANEIAQKLHTTVSNVTSQRQRAIRHLRGLLAEEEWVMVLALTFACQLK